MSQALALPPEDMTAEEFFPWAEPVILDDPEALVRLPSLGFAAPLAAFYAGTGIEPDPRP